MTLDIQLLYALNSLAGQTRFFDNVIIFLASYLPYLLVLIFLLFVFLSPYARREKWELILTAGMAGVVARFGVTELIRFFYHHPRPFMVLPVHQLLAETSWSFPSGHAMFFFAFSTAIYLYDKKWGIGFLIASALISISRVIAGVHYPSDVIAGAIMGVLTAYGTFSIFRALNRTY